MSATTLPFTSSPQLDPTGVEQAEAGADDSWWADANAALDLLAETGVPFTAADVTGLGVADPDKACRWGALMAAASRQHRIVEVAAMRSPRRTRRGGLCLQWVGADAAPGGRTE